MMEVPIFFDYAVYNDDGYISGIQDNAPEEMKTAYQEWLKEQDEYRKQGIKV